MTTLKSDRYTLMRGSKVLGSVQIRPENEDFPWYGGVFQPADAFNEVAAQFAEELRLLNEDKMDQWGMAYDTLTEPGLKLVSMIPNQEINDFIIHIDGAKTWFRC